ncbi:MAG TPA: ABC transporter ATP-binding protein [Candidatus Acidoferrum sp.]|jgi:spermidine/putrescine transport system ATP-binding protein|nr:ABC transporter ATP-binding protein [Candidatus Acidoferrum sp.]
MSEPAPAEAHPANGDSVVVLDQVVKRFGTVVAVDRLTLEIERGEFFSMLGPSGCGKTTTLRLIGGFEMPTEGVVRLDGQDVTDLPAYKRNVNTVFQSYGLFPHLSVYDNVAFGLRRKKVPGKEVERRVVEALELVSLAGYGKRRRSQLSGGQQQRVALARALVNRPQVLLLDEPLGALDLKLRKQMQLELKRIQKEVGITFVFVTHDQEEAMTISDRIAVMNNGKIEQLGRPEDVYERPATVFVAEFLGASNLLDGTYRGTHGGWGEVELANGVRIRIPVEQDRRDGESLRVGVRPEKIQVIPVGAEPPATQNVVPATLRSAVFAGVSFQYFFRTSEGREMTAFDRNSTGGAVAKPGDAVRLAWAPQHTFVIPVGESVIPAETTG